MIACDPATQPAVLAFREILENDPTGTRQQFAEIEQEFLRRGLLFGDDPLPLCFAPALITGERQAAVRGELVRLMRLLFRLEDTLRSDLWMERLGIHPAERELIRIPSGFPAGRAISRVDGFLGEAHDGDSGYRTVEINVDSPGGGAFMDACARLLRKTPAWREFCGKFPGKYLPTDTRVLPLLLDCWKCWGGKDKPRVAIVDWITVGTAQEFELLSERFRRAGVDTVVADPRELEYRDGRLRCYDGIPIDLVYRRVLVEDLMSHGEEARALLQAYRRRSVCVVNSFACKPLTVKSLLAWIHREEIEDLLSAADLGFLRRVIPWTAQVHDDPTLERLRRERETLVLKPADGWGAQGIFLGWQCTAGQWDEALDQALQQNYVAQRRVPIPLEEFPVACGSAWKYTPFRVDFDPYMFGLGVADPLVRMSGGEVLNVKAGARIAVTWVLR